MEQRNTVILDSSSSDSSSSDSSSDSSDDSPDEEFEPRLPYVHRVLKGKGSPSLVTAGAWEPVRLEAAGEP
jgi:hypothetical protein